MRSEELIVIKAQINLFSMTACNLMGLNDLYPELCLLSPTAYCLLPVAYCPPPYCLRAKASMASMAAPKAAQRRGGMMDRAGRLVFNRWVSWL